MDLESVHVDEAEVTKEIARLKSYVLAIYTIGPRDRSDETIVSATRMKHVAYLFRLRKAGRLLVNCPVEDDHIRGISIYDATVNEARAWLEVDPMVEAGFLRFEIHPCAGLPGDVLR